MTLREKLLTNENNRLGIICEEKKSCILNQPNSKLVIYKDLPGKSICVMIHPTNIAGIPRDIEDMPSLVTYSYKQNGIIDMHKANVTSRTVVIPPKSIICEIQPITIEDHKKKDYLAQNKEKKNIFDQISIDSTNVTNDQHQAIIDLIKRYEHIFSANDHGMGQYIK